MADQHLARGTRKTPHPIRFHLRDGRALEGRVFLTERDCWAPFLSTRKRCVSVTEALWPGLGEEPHGHVVLPTANILIAAPLDQAVTIVNRPPAAKPLRVELYIEDGIVLWGEIALVPGQRLSEFFDQADAFLPIFGAAVHPNGPELGDIVLATAAVYSLRELSPEEF